MALQEFEGPVADQSAFPEGLVLMRAIEHLQPLQGMTSQRTVGRRTARRGLSSSLPFSPAATHASRLRSAGTARCLAPVLWMAGAMLSSGASIVRASVPAQEAGLAADAVTVVTAKDAQQRQMAMLRVYNPDLLVALARNEKDAEVRRTAILLLEDQEELKRLALDPHAAVREAAVLGISDEAFLLSRVHGRAEASPTVRAAAVAALRTQAAIAEAALTGFYGDVREAAAARATDPPLVDRVTAAQDTIAARTRAIQSGEMRVGLVALALGGDFDVVCQAAAESLQAQDDLAAVALASSDRDVLKIVLGKLADPSLLRRIATTAADAPMRLAAASKAGTRKWADIFAKAAGKAAAAPAPGDALAAVALFADAKPDAKEAVQQQCLIMIRQGDESRIPEMMDLLMLYGDVPLAEDYLNCGQPDLGNGGARWAGIHGYSVGRGYGSNRANWGSAR